jgi:hypothetical protein
MATRSLYAAWCAISAVVLLSGQHRAFYRLLDALSVPALAAAALTGIANLAWYELAYAVGSGLKSPRLFAALPWVGIAAGLAAAAGLLVGGRWPRRLALLQLGCGLAVGGLALGVVAWRTVRGFDDPWRLVTTIALLAAHAAWLTRFWRAPADGL